MIDLSNTQQLISFLNNNSEVEFFRERHQSTLELAEKLNELIKAVFFREIPQTSEAVSIFMLGRLSIRHFESITILAATGHGFSAMRVLRSMVEKYVDAAFLYKKPKQIDVFWNHQLVSAHLRGYSNLDSIDADWENKIKQYQTKNGKFRLNWSKESFREKAKYIGLDSWLLENSYTLSNSFVHSSTDEILFSFEKNDNGLTPVGAINEHERVFASAAYHMAINILFSMFEVQIKHYQLQKAESKFNEVSKLFVNAIKMDKAKQ